jgi:hypothetical protein
MDNETLLRAANGARIAEAVANYGRAEVHAGLSGDVGIPHATWFRGDTQAREAANFLERVPRELIAA